MYHTICGILCFILGNMESWPKISSKNHLLNTILSPWQYWLGITKPKSAFRMFPIDFKKFLFNAIFYCLSACLMPSDKCNSIIASYFIQCCFSLTDAPQYVQCTHHGLTFVLLCVPFLFVNSRRYQFVITRC